MATAGPQVSPAPASSNATPPTALGRAIELAIRAATSWAGAITAYLAAITGVVVAIVNGPLKDIQLWARIALLSGLLVCALVFHAIPTLIEQRRKKRLTEITGNLQAGYFRLAPRDEESSYTRADGIHQEILRWLEKRNNRVLYLTGLSGSGKSSLLTAWVLPKLERADTVVIRLRAYQDPLAALEQELRKPEVIWQKPPQEPADLKSLLERASQYIKPKRLLIALDQFEEFVILEDPDKQKRFADLLCGLRDKPIGDITFLLVFRTEYAGLIERLRMPPIDQNTDRREVPPFSEREARDFMHGSGLQFNDELLRDVLHEAAEIEQTKGLIRPITINLCGFVLSRFASGVPPGFRPGGLIRGFLRETILLPHVRDIAPRLIPHLISKYVTKWPRTVAQLAEATGINAAQVRGCLRVLGQMDRAIVRPLDTDQQLWEISHDFLVPLLESIVSRWTVSVVRRVRPWVPWMATVVVAVGIMAASNWRKDPIAELTEIGWAVKRNDKELVLSFRGVPSERSIQDFSRIEIPLRVSLVGLTNDTIPELGKLKDVKNLTSLDLSGTLFVQSPLSDVSPLKDLKTLTSLDLNFTQVSDASPLKGLKNLASLNLSNTKVSDLSPLKDLRNLTSLDLELTNVSDVSPLKDLKNLASLNLGSTKVSDLSPLKDLKNLTWLDLRFTTVSGVSPLKDLKNITSLNLMFTRVSDVSPLKDLRNLASLNLSSTKVSDVSPLKDLRNFASLNLSSTKVSDLSPLKDLRYLVSLNLSSTKVSDVSPLKDLRDLASLNLSSTKVSDVSPLKDLENLASLDLTLTKVSDVSPLKDLKNLTSLDLGGTKEIDVSSLKYLKHLEILRARSDK